ATFATPDLTTFCRLDELGLVAVGQRLAPDRAVIECRVAEPDPWCRKCGTEGVMRDTVARRLAHATYRDLVPWKVLEVHRTACLMKRVRSLAARQLGKTLDPTEVRLLNEWILNLSTKNLILDYHPAAPRNDASSTGGFYYAVRKPGEKGLFRAPAERH